MSGFPGALGLEIYAVAKCKRVGLDWLLESILEIWQRHHCHLGFSTWTRSTSLISHLQVLHSEQSPCVASHG